MHDTHRRLPLWVSRLAGYMLAVIVLLAGEIASAEPSAFLAEALAPFAAVDSSVHIEPYPILKPLAGEPLKVLFVGARSFIGPLCPAMDARLACRYDSVLTPSRSSLGEETYGDDSPVSPDVVGARLERMLGYRWDVIVLDVEIAMLSARELDLLTDHLSISGGLVYVGNRRDLRQFVDSDRADRAPLDALSYFPNLDIQAGRHGNGIWVAIPGEVPGREPRDRADYLNTFAAAIHFSAHGAAGIHVTGIDMSGKPVEQEVVSLMHYQLNLYNPGPRDSVTVTARVRDREGIVRQTVSSQFIADREQSFTVLRFPLLPIGEYSLDLTVSDEDGGLSFGGVRFSVENEDRLTEVSLWNPTATAGKYLFGSVAFSMDITDGIYLSARIETPAGAMMDSVVAELVPGRRSVDYALRIPDDASLTANVFVDFYKNNELVQEERRTVFIESPPVRQGISCVVIARGNGTGDPNFSVACRSLAGAGGAALGFDVSQGIMPGDVRARAVDAGIAGLPLIPMVPSEPTVAPEWMRALRDSLGSAPPAALLMIPDSSQAAEGIVPSPDLIGGAWETSSGSAVPVGVMIPLYAGRLDAFRDIPYDFAVIPGRMIDPRNPAGTRLAGSPLSGLLVQLPLTSDDGDRFLDWVPWMSLFLGLDTVWWDDLEGGTEAALTPSLVPSPAFLRVMRQIDSINRGPGMLVSGIAGSVFTAPGPDTSMGWGVDANVVVLDGRSVPVETVCRAVYRDGGAVYIGLLRDYRDIAGPDSFTVSLGGGMGMSGYDLLAGLPIDMGPSFSVELPPGGAGMYALLPYSVRNVALSLDRTIASPGDTVTWRAGIVTRDGSTPGHHVFSVIAQSDAEHAPVLSSLRVEAEAGEAMGTFVVPDTYKGRRISLVVLDVASGKESVATVVVQQIPEVMKAQ